MGSRKRETLEGEGESDYLQMKFKATVQRLVMTCLTRKLTECCIITLCIICLIYIQYIKNLEKPKNTKKIPK